MILAYSSDLQASVLNPFHIFCFSGCCMGLHELRQILLESDGLPAQDAGQAGLGNLEVSHQPLVLAGLTQNLPERFQVHNHRFVEVWTALPDLGFPGCIINCLDGDLYSRGISAIGGMCYRNSLQHACTA